MHFSILCYNISIEQIFLFYLILFFFVIFHICFLTNIKLLIHYSLLLNYIGFLFLFIISINKIQYIYTIYNSILFLDSLSILFLLMVFYIIPLCILYTGRSLSISIKPILICILLTEFFVLLCFSVRNFFFFYICFELVLLPMFLLIFLYGSRTRRIYASFLFFFYTFLGSLFLLVAILFIFNHLGSLNFDDFILFPYLTQFTFFDQSILFFLLFVGFAVKIPIMPFHNWLPEAHVEAPTVGSVILASILLKLGGYGILRVIVPLLHDYVLYIRVVPIVLGLISCLYASFIAFRHFDTKKIIAYSSIMHMNLSLIGFWMESKFCFVGAIISMLAHSFTSAGLFFIAGFFYEKFHTRNVLYYSHLYSNLNLFYFFIFFFILSNLGIPLTLSFTGELFLYIGFGSSIKTLLFLLSFVFFFSGIFGFVLLYRLIYSVNKQNHKEILKYKQMSIFYASPNYFGQSNNVFYTRSEFIILLLLLSPLLLLFFFGDLYINLIYLFVNTL